MKAVIELFEHNKAAYEAALLMMEKRQRAAIIHPTGTGKSFIGFKLCEEHPQKTVLWLSPSEYIFKIQLENLKKASGDILENITFVTYAKLMNMSYAEKQSLKADFIILDEFHRCGASEWGRGVIELLECHESSKILGLSATSIRYLDSQRDMAEELFCGNVASEISLSEAVVNGILPKAKYILSCYSFNSDLKRYEDRVKNSKSLIVKDKSEGIIEELKRALSMSLGLDEIFFKHMTEKKGKYIVFCSDFAHMNEMISYADKWFFKVDSDPHIYKVYSEDRSAEKELEGFKNDNSEHLKLLYCIDALNEGVHIDGVSGVILLRPTVSPIIYKQQIGRALASGSKGTPVIFDIAMNIESLYSIGYLEDEMDAVVTYYKSHGMDDKIVNSSFEIIDEVKDCVELFDRLSDVLSASWELMYEKAAQYYKEYGNLEVPVKYKTQDGYSLGHFLLTQRRIRNGEHAGKLTSERIKMLDEIGMVWDSYRDISWEKNFSEAKKYYDTFGDLNVPSGYVSNNGVKLGAWISKIRNIRKNNSQRKYLTEKRIKALDEIGMVWSVSDRLWHMYYGACVEYKEAYNNLDVPHKYVTDSGVKLGVWLNNVKAAHNGYMPEFKITEEQFSLLEELGIKWNSRSDRLFEEGYLEAVKYKMANGNLDVPSGYVSPSGYKLGAWISRQRGNLKLTSERRERLDKIGMIWTKSVGWEYKYSLAKEYYCEHGSLNVPSDYIKNGVWLNKWINEQRQIYLGKRKDKALTCEQIDMLDKIGMRWESKR